VDKGNGAAALLTRALLAAQHAAASGGGRAARRASEVEVSRKRARQRLARPSMFMVPMKEVLVVLIGLYLLVRLFLLLSSSFWVFGVDR